MTELKLEDLRVMAVDYVNAVTGVTRYTQRKATLADLLVVLQQHGEMVKWCETHDRAAEYQRHAKCAVRDPTCLPVRKWLIELPEGEQ